MATLAGFVSGCGSSSTNAVHCDSSGAGVAPSWSALPDPVICDAGWCLRSPFPQGNALHAAWASSRTDVWFGGESGTLLHWDGAHWTRTASGTADPISALWGAAPGDVWAGAGPDAPGAGGEVLRWDGATWSRALDVESAPLLAGGDARDVWAWSGAVYRFDGAAWTRCAGVLDCETARPNGQTTVTSIWASSADAWAVGTPGLRVSPTAWHWDGTHWLPVASNAGGLGLEVTDVFNGVWGLGPENAWLFGQHGVYHWDGAHLRSSDSRAALAGWGSGPQDVWAATGDRSNPLLRWNGSSWSATCGVHGFAPTILTGTAADDVWAVGGPRIGHFDGTSWRELSAVALDGPAAAAGVRNGEVWAVGGARLARWDGTSLLSTASPAKLNVIATAGDDVFAAGSSGTVLHWDGRALTQLASPDPGAELVSVWASGPADLWVAAGDQVFHHDGRAWQGTRPVVPATAPSGAPEFLIIRVWGTGPSDVFAFGNFGSVAHFDGTGWSTVHDVASGVVDVAGSPGDVWAVTDFKASHWNGSGWTSFEGLPQLRGVWEHTPGDVWAVGLGGAIVRWNGATWSAYPSPTTEDLLSVHGLASGEAWAVGAHGTILQWNGAAWTRVPLSMAGTMRQVVAVGPGQAWAFGAEGEVLHHAAP